MAAHSLLIVDDDPVSIRALGRILTPFGATRFAKTGLDALRLARESKPDLILLDSEMPGMSGLDVCKAIKADPQLEDIAVIFITSHGEEASEVSALEAGAADFISKPPRAPLVIARVRTQLRLKDAIGELRRAAVVDSLTGIGNRRRFDEALNEEWTRAQRSGAPLSVLMIDVDFFKRYNDRYGHVAGDECLRSVAQALAQACRRPTDVVTRYGGEEFALLLPETDGVGAQHVAERVLDAVTALGMRHESSPVADHVTVSVGAASLEARDLRDRRSRPVPRSEGGGPSRVAMQLVAAADHVLYTAKQTGRNRACFERLSRLIIDEDSHAEASETTAQRGKPQQG